MRASMSLRVPLGLALCLCLAVMGLPAAAADDAPAAFAPCTPQETQTISVDTFVKDFTPYFDKCLKMRGMLMDGALFASLDRAYDRNHRGLQFVSDRIGIWGIDEATTTKLWSMRAPVEIVGRASGCEREVLQAELKSPPEEEFWTMGGACLFHQPLGMIRVESLRILGRKPARLTGEAERRRIGNFVPGERIVSAANRATARAWFAAVAARDADALFHLQSRGDADLDWDRSLVDPAHSAYAPLFGRSDFSAIRYFAVGPRGPGDATHRQLFACVCVLGNCTREWPIDSLDTRSIGDPPFRCAVFAFDGGIGATG
jgi:hypothetical protein